MSRSLGGTPLTSRSSMKMEPSSTGSSPASIRRVVDLPQPEGPTSTMNSPSPISRSSPGTAGAAVPGYQRWAPLNVTVATIALLCPHASACHSQPVAGDHVGIPACRVLRSTTLIGEIDVDQAEALVVAPGPLEVVQQRPHVVAADVGSLRECLVDRRQVVAQVADAALVVYAPALEHVLGAETVLRDVHRQARVAVDAQQQVGQPRGHD